MIMIAALLVCCSLLYRINQTQLMRSETLTRLEPKNIGGSRADMRLPWYTSGF